MSELEILRDKLYAIKKGMPELVLEVLEDNASLIEDLNIEQMRRGERVDGSKLPNYSPGSVRRFGKRPGPMTLEDTGKYYRGITAKFNRSFAEIIGMDSKTSMLEKRYGDTTGLQEASIDIVVNEMLAPGLIEKIGNRLAL